MEDKTQRAENLFDKCSRKLGQNGIYIVTLICLILFPHSLGFFVSFSEIDKNHIVIYIILLFLTLLSAVLFILTANKGIAYLRQIQSSQTESFPVKDQSAIEPKQGYRYSHFHLGYSLLPLILIVTGLPFIITVIVSGFTWFNDAIIPFIWMQIFAIFNLTGMSYTFTDFYISPFEKNRKVIDKFSSYWCIFIGKDKRNNHFRVFIYADGLEIRQNFLSYFIPYEKMKDPEINGSKETKWYHYNPRGILITSDVPEVPSSIILGFDGDINNIKNAIIKQRHNYLAQKIEK